MPAPPQTETRIGWSAAALRALALLGGLGGRISELRGPEDVGPFWRRLARRLHPDRPGGSARDFARARAAITVVHEELLRDALAGYSQP